MRWVWAWIEERTGWAAAVRGVFDREYTGGAGIRHAFPAVLVYLFVQQALLGVTLSLFYSPSASDAWASTAYLTDQVTMGWFVRGLHYHGASAFVVVSGLYVLSLAASAAYRRPHELEWFAALAMVGLSLAFGLTGNPLPWDQQGFWSIQVELGIVESTPGGAAIRNVVQGGDEMGNLSVLRLFTIHAFVLPIVFGALLAFAIGQRRRHGVTPPLGLSEHEAARRTVRYAPSQLFVDVLAIAITSAALVAGTIATHGSELYAPADPVEAFQARPEWYFLALYKLRALFEGPLEPIATMVAPGAVAAFLITAPFIERAKGRAGRTLVVVGLGLVMTGVVGLTGWSIVADRGDEDYQKALAQAHSQAQRARELAFKGVHPQGGTAVFWNDPDFKVKLLFKEHCLGCHTVEGFGGDEAPELTDYSSRQWLRGLIRDPNQPRYFGNTKHDDMDAYPEDSVSDEQLTATVEYIVSLMGDPAMAVNPELASTGKTLWEDELECNSCHEVKPGESGDGPNLSGHGSKAWVARVIRDSSRADLFGEAAEMPTFADKLTDEEIDQLAAYVVSLREPSESK
jgi:ubiquinol-cytochrome c reductase cytochrome b subunit